MIPKNTKVYIINKTIGRGLYGVKERSSISRENIVNKGGTYNAIIGYYQRYDRNAHVIDYTKDTNTGDFYNRTDFITEEELRTVPIRLDDDLFEI